MRNCRELLTERGNESRWRSGWVTRESPCEGMNKIDDLLLLKTIGRSVEYVAARAGRRSPEGLTLKSQGLTLKS